MTKISEILEKNEVVKNNKIITRTRYLRLKNAKPGLLTDEHYAEIEAYEKHELEQRQAVIQPKKEIEKIKGLPINKQTLWELFVKEFWHQNGREFEKTPESLYNLEPIIKYFARDPDFLNCKALAKTIDNKPLKNSLYKGLLVVGSYGNGKTEYLKIVSKAIYNHIKTAKENHHDNIGDWQSIAFSCQSMHDVVTDFECIKTPEERNDFYKFHTIGRKMFDDILNEKTASNFGKTELFREIFEKRYDGRKTTFATCNYHKDYKGNVDKALHQFGIRYGGHIYDRLFEMFNIIEFTGTSFRKKV